MNKSIIFGIGFVVGAISGGVGTYFLTKDKIENDAADIIDQYAEHCRERIASLTGQKENDEEETEDADESESSVSSDIQNNEGVKKYHKDLNLSTANPYKEEVKNVTEGEKALAEEKAGKIIKNKPYQIDEEQFIKEAQAYDKVTLEYYCQDDTLMVADPEEVAEVAYNVGREELIGEIWRLGQDHIPEGKEDGVVYVRNDNMSIDFEIIVYDRAWSEVSGEGEE